MTLTDHVLTTAKELKSWHYHNLGETMKRIPFTALKYTQWRQAVIYCRAPDGIAVTGFYATRGTFTNTMQDIQREQFTPEHAVIIR